MEKTPAVEFPHTKPGVSGRVVALLAGAVLVLSAAFIVLIACGTWLLQQRESGENTTPTTWQDQQAVTRNVDVVHNKTETLERITFLTESNVEFIVNRNAASGHVETVVTIDYAKKSYIMYKAANNACFMMRGYDFVRANDVIHDVMDEERINAEEERRLNVRINGRVENSSEIPLQMAAFCTPQNTFQLEMFDPEQDERVKRQIPGQFLCLIDCEFVTFLLDTDTGIVYACHLCLYYFDWSIDCNSPDSGVFLGNIYERVN